MPAATQTCGLCHRTVHDWDAHVAGREHRANLANRQRVLDAACASSADTLSTLYYLSRLEAQCRAAKPKRTA